MVRRVFQYVYREVKGIHQAAYLLALFALGSQFLAIIRDRLLAHSFGAGRELDLYYAAFRIPDILFVLFASVLSVYVLLPFVAAGRYKTILSQLFTVFLVLYTGLALALAALAPWYVPLLFPGLTDDMTSLIQLQQVILLQPLLLGISNICGVITQFHHRFVLYAISPILYNIGIIFGVLVLYPSLGLVGLAWGVVLGAFGHLAVQWPFVRRSTLAFRPTRRIQWSEIFHVLQVALPRAATLSLQQVVLLVLIGMATNLAAGSITVFQFAFNLQAVPLAIIGMSYSVAAFPTLSRLSASGEIAAFNRQLLVALRHIIFWSVPVIALVIVLRAQIVRVLLGSGMFDWGDTRLTAAVLAIFIVGLAAQASLLLLIRAFYASGRVLQPLFIALASTAVTIAGAVVTKYWYQTSPEWRQWLEGLLRLEGVVGTEVVVLAGAYVLGSVVQLVLMVIITRQVFGVSLRPLGRLSLQALAAAVVGGVVAYGALTFVVDGVNQEKFLGIALQGLVAGLAGVAAVIATYFVLRAPELREIYRAFHNKIFKSKVITTAPDSL